jgi:transposase
MQAEYVAASAGAGAVRLRAWSHGTVVDNSGERMVISKETEVEILRLFHVEKWRKNTIATQLGIHHSTVDRALAQNGVAAEELRVKPSIADPYVDFIKDTLKEYPKLNATRLFHMVRERGYPGKVDHFRDIVARYRQRPKMEARLRVRTIPGEQAQADWGHFGKIKFGNAERKLYGFVLTLSWSRHIFLRFYVNQGTANFQRGHIDAFEFFGGRLTHDILYDNLKSVVLERIGKAIHFNPEMLGFVAHYRYKPVPVEKAMPEHKGRVERGIRYVRSSFWPARKFRDLEDLNVQALAWCMEEAGEREWVQDKSLTVLQAFEQEKPYLMAVPEAPYVVYDRKEVHIGKTPYARFDLNDYSIPAEHVRKTLSVFATLETVRICDGVSEIATHKRSFEKEKQIEKEAHIEELWEAKKAGRKHRAMDRLQHACPSSTQLFVEAGKRGHNLGRLTQELNSFLSLYGAQELEMAIKATLAAQLVHASAVRQALEQRRNDKGLHPVVKLRFESNEKANELTITPRSLEIYDSLIKKEDEE